VVDVGRRSTGAAEVVTLTAWVARIWHGDSR